MRGVRQINQAMCKFENLSPLRLGLARHNSAQPMQSGESIERVIRNISSHNMFLVSIGFF
jgi:hypothetical protein